jgi:hypothetical protein
MDIIVNRLRIVVLTKSPCYVELQNHHFNTIIASILQMNFEIRLELS